MTDFLTRHQQPIALVGAVLILLYGLVTLLQARRDVPSGHTGRSAQVAGFASAFTVALLNPATIVSFMVAFSTMGLTGNYSPFEGAMLVLGVLTGTGLWWLTLCGAVSLLKKKITPRIYRVIRLILGALMMLFGAVMLIQNAL